MLENAILRNGPPRSFSIAPLYSLLPLDFAFAVLMSISTMKKMCWREKLSPSMQRVQSLRGSHAPCQPQPRARRHLTSWRQAAGLISICWFCPSCLIWRWPIVCSKPLGSFFGLFLPFLRGLDHFSVFQGRTAPTCCCCCSADARQSQRLRRRSATRTSGG